MWSRRRELSEVSLIGYVVLAITFFLQIAIARLLGTTNFGLYSAVLAAVSIIEVPLVSRGSEVAMRVLGEAWQRGNVGEMRSLARRMVRYDGLLFFSTFLFLFLVAFVLRDLLGTKFWLFVILAMVIPAQAGFGVFKSYFTIFGKVSEMARYELTYVLLLAGLNLGGMLTFGIYGLAASMVVAMLVKTYLAYVWTRWYLPPADVGDSSAKVVSLTREGLFSIVRNLFANGFNQVDVVILGVLQKPEVVALYKVGKSLASLPIKVSFPVWRYLQPRLLEAIQKRDSRREKRLIVNGAVVLVLVMLCIIPPVLVFGKSIIAFLYGEAYSAAFDNFIILLVGIWAFHGISGWFKFWVVITRSRWYGIGVYAVGFVAAIALGIAFGGSSAVAMSYVMTFVLLSMSAMAFAKVFRA